MLNSQNELGDTPLHHGFLHETSLEIVEYLLSNNPDLTIRNKRGQSVFHYAVKYYNSLLEANIIDLLLEHGANVNEIDNLGFSVLHEAFKSSYVNRDVIEKLLKIGAYPDFRNEFGTPPLAYCTNSTLQPDEKKSVEKILIQYSVIKKMNLIQENSHEIKEFGDAVICFHFCKDKVKRNEWISFRDSCIAEITEIGKVSLELDYTLFQFLTDYSCNVDKCLNSFNIKTILCKLQKNEYPIFREMLLSAIEKYDFEDLIEDLLTLDLTYTCPSGTVINMSLECISKVFEFLPKKNLINFILAFYEF